MDRFLFNAHWLNRKKTARISRRAKVRRLVRNGGDSCGLPEVVGKRLNAIDARVRRDSLVNLGNGRVRNAGFLGDFLVPAFHGFQVTEDVCQ